MVAAPGPLKHGELTNLDFPGVAKREYGIGACEYVNQFFKDKAQDDKYLAELNQRAAGEGVQNVLIMIDDEGALGDPDDAKRTQAVQNHHNGSTRPRRSAAIRSASTPTARALRRADEAGRRRAAAARRIRSRSTRST